MGWNICRTPCLRLLTSRGDREETTSGEAPPSLEERTPASGTPWSDFRRLARTSRIHQGQAKAPARTKVNNANGCNGSDKLGYQHRQPALEKRFGTQYRLYTIYYILNISHNLHVSFSSFIERFGTPCNYILYKTTTFIVIPKKQQKTVRTLLSVGSSNI